MAASSAGLVGRGLVLLVTVSGGLACGARPPLDLGNRGGSATINMEPADGSAAAPDAGAPVAAVTGKQAEQAMMARWNQVADGIPSSFNFHWDPFDKFPHPTYQGGTAQGYQAFAVVLLAFFRADDNFDFLAANHLFGVRLRYVFPSGQVGLDTSFAELAVYFSSSAAFGGIPDDTRAAIKAFADRIPPGS